MHAPRESTVCFGWQWNRNLKLERVCDRLFDAAEKDPVHHQISAAIPAKQELKAIKFKARSKQVRTTPTRTQHHTCRLLVGISTQSSITATWNIHRNLWALTDNIIWYIHGSIQVTNLSSELNSWVNRATLTIGAVTWHTQTCDAKHQLTTCNEGHTNRSQ